MAKQRYIDTKFWSDSFIVDLNPLDRYLFLYLLTNEHTNIAGVYELPLIRMAQESGIDKEMLPKMLNRLKGRIDYFSNWIIIKNFQRHQKQNDSVIMGIKKVMDELPIKIRDFHTKISDTPQSVYRHPPDTEISEPEPESKLKPESKLEKREQPSPKEKAQSFFQEEEIQNAFISRLVEKGVTQDIAAAEIKKFVSYWTELNHTGTKQRWQGQPYFDVSRRIATWISKAGQYSKGQIKTKFSFN